MQSAIMSFDEFKKKLPILHDVKYSDSGVEYIPKYNRYSGTVMYFKHGRSNSEKVSLAKAYEHYKYLASKNEKYGKGGKTPRENLEKELKRLQRDLNSSRLRTYIQGDNSEEAKALRKEREVKLARFNEVLSLLREAQKQHAKGGQIKDCGCWHYEVGGL